MSVALPGKSFESIALSDAPPEVAMSLISRQLGNVLFALFVFSCSN